MGVPKGPGEEAEGQLSFCHLGATLAGTQRLLLLYVYPLFRLPLMSVHIGDSYITNLLFRLSLMAARVGTE